MDRREFLKESLIAIGGMAVDAFTLSLVAVPIYLLFEVSVLIVKRVET